MKNRLFFFTTFNHVNFTKVCLESFALYTNFREGDKVVIFDNRSTDGTQEFIKEKYPEYELVILTPEQDCLPLIWNMAIDRLEENTDLVLLPNDVVVSPGWDGILEEDLYSAPEKVQLVSPYMNCDLEYDDKVNEQWSNEYYKFYENLRNDPTYEELNAYLNQLHDGNHEEFCENFIERNKNEPPIDSSLTHVIYFKGDLFKKYKLRFDETLKPFGGHEFLFHCEMNNLDLFRIGSSRTYVFHWMSITDREVFKDGDSEKRKLVYRNCMKPIQKYKPIPSSATFLGGPKPKNIPNWRTPYYKFELRNPELTFEEAIKIPGIKYMNYEGLHPGHNYFNQIQVGSIVREKGNSAKVVGRDLNNDLLISLFKNDLPPNTPNCFNLSEKWFLKRNFHIDHYWREEEDRYFGLGHMDFLLEK